MTIQCQIDRIKLDIEQLVTAIFKLNAKIDNLCKRIDGEVPESVVVE